MSRIAAKYPRIGARALSTGCLSFALVLSAQVGCSSDDGGATNGLAGSAAGANAGGVAGTLATAGTGIDVGGAGVVSTAGTSSTAGTDVDVGGAAGEVSAGAGGDSSTAGVAAAGSGSAGDGTAGTGEAGTGVPPGGACLDKITDYDKAGPFTFKMKTSGAMKFWVPDVPPGCKVPVVHMANGTGATCSNYQGAIDRLASHGFLTACYESTQTGAGTQGLMALDTALSMFPDVADKRFGSTGHSQGGQSSVIALQLAEAKYGTDMIYAGLAMEPASGYGTQPAGGTWQSVYAKVKSPVFMFSGDSATGYANSKLAGMSKGDGLVAITWVQEGFDALDDGIEAYHWTAIGATHIPTPVGPEQQISIPWFRWKLLGDKAACMYFKKMNDGTKWKSQKEQNAASCD